MPGYKVIEGLDRSSLKKTQQMINPRTLPLSIANILGNADSIDDEKTVNMNRPQSSNSADSEFHRNDNEDSCSDDDEVEIEVDVNAAEDEDMKSDTSSTKLNSGKNNQADKQTPSYTAIIAQAILSSPDKKLPLGSIYEYIADHFPEFLKKGQGWRNCVRHNLSLSECFIKAGRARNGRGNYWGIHPRYLKNFSKGDFRKRRASHRPRNRDLSIGLHADRFHYSHFLSPFLLQNQMPPRATHRSFSVESLLSPDRGTTAFDSYKPWIAATKPEAARLPTSCMPSSFPWMDSKLQGQLHFHPSLYSSGLPVSTEPVHRSCDLISRTDLNGSSCSCHMYCCTRS